MTWLAAYLGIPFHAKDVKLKKAGRISEGHESRQVAPLRVAMWRLLESMLKDMNEFRKTLAFFWVMMVVSVVRPKHLQSSVVHVCGFRFEGHCTMSKGRIDGRRRPFWWAASTIGLSGANLADTWAEVQAVAGAGSSRRPFIMPDFLPPRASLSEVSGFADVPMPRARILAFSNELFHYKQVPRALLDDISGLYAGRRVLPTVADVAQCNPSERLDVGGWYCKEAAAKAAMPNRYNAVRLYVQADVKHCLVQGVAAAVRKLESSRGAPKDPSWEQIFDFWPAGKRNKLAREGDKSFTEERGANQAVERTT